MSNKLLRKKKKPPGTNPPAAAAPLIQTALLLHQAGNPQQAETYYRQALALEPANPSANHLLGTLYYQHGHPAAALPLVEKAIRVKPDYVDAQQLLGSIHLALGHYAPAIRAYRQALSYQPDLATAHHSLGIALKVSGQYQGALDSFQRALDIQPRYAEAHANQGIVYWLQGRIDAALASYGRALILQPDFLEAYPNFSALMKLRKTLPAALGSAHDRKNLLSHCLERNDLQAQNFSSAAYQELFQGDTLAAAQQFMASAENPQSCRQLLDEPPLRQLFSEPLFLLLLRKTIIVDPFAEGFLTTLRKGLLALLATPERDAQLCQRLLPLVCALAQQGFWNEYVWQTTAVEGEVLAAIEAQLGGAEALATPPARLALALLACYVPLHTLALAERIPENSAISEQDFSELIRVQLREPRQEKELRGKLRAFSEVRDEVSQLVRQQYEENPYPRWTGIARVAPRPFGDWLRQFIAPNAPPLLPTSERPEVLIAGCGTGQHPLRCATSYLHAAVVAIDLSRASLAYAQRKAIELGISNIEFIQGDILALAQLGKSFDIIESSGVLHHMRQPEQGLAVLLGLLRPTGYLKIGLYSELARSHIVAAREFVANQGFAPTLAGIRAARQALLALPADAPARLVASSPDFYATSTVRDLIFHVQEQHYTLPRLARVLEDFNLEFLGFDLDGEIKNAYLAAHGDDPGAVSLANWHLYEEQNPGTFVGMYDFWVRKKTPAGS